MVIVRRSVLDEPRPVDVPPVGRLDGLFVAAFVAAVVVEGAFRPDLAWRPVVTLLALVLAPALLRRRDRPLLAALTGWGVAGLLSVLQLTVHDGSLGLDSMLAVLVLLYALVRWGSGREIVVGTAFVTVVGALGMYAASAGWAELFGGTALLLFLVALAAVFRYRADLWHRQQREIRNQERVALAVLHAPRDVVARELHDDDRWPLVGGVVAHEVEQVARGAARRAPHEGVGVADGLHEALDVGLGLGRQRVAVDEHAVARCRRGRRGQPGEQQRDQDGEELPHAPLVRRRAARLLGGGAAGAVA